MTGVPRTDTRTLRYDDAVRAVVAYHRERGELVDFFLMKGGAIVGMYRLRSGPDQPWTDLLPTGASPRRYREVIQRLAPILFPGQELTIVAAERGDAEMTVTVELPDPPNTQDASRV